MRTNEVIIEEIKYILETQVQPMVAQHRGRINFKSFDEGILTVEMSGSCAGCRGSQMTLKLAVEDVIMDQIPEVKGVNSVNDPNPGAMPWM